jgi:hypothetical protein
LEEANDEPSILGVLLVLGAAHRGGWLPSGTPGTPGTPAPGKGRIDHSSFDEILRQTVRGERVDYRLIRERYLKQLDGYLDQLAQVDPQTLSRDEQLAMYINLYNATMIRAVIDRYHPGYSPSENHFAVFEEPLVRVAGKAMSLNDLENVVIRPEFKEPRIHVALVCAARSCPPLLPRAYWAQDLQATLEANMRRFVHDTTRNRVDIQNQRLELSQLFNWYVDDFGGKRAVATYFDRYHDAEVAGYAVSFLEYSWELNSTSD